jgi:hypothetical protein
MARNPGRPGRARRGARNSGKARRGLIPLTRAEGGSTKGGWRAVGTRIGIKTLSKFEEA